jgi:hypothetical protein
VRHIVENPTEEEEEEGREEEEEGRKGNLMTKR